MWTSQGFQLVVSSRRSEKRRSAMMNQMVSSSFRYVSGKGDVFFPAHGLSGRSRDMNFLLFSTEV